MKTQSLATIGLVKELAQILGAIKNLEAREKELKEKLKNLMGQSLILEAGNYSVIRDVRNRKDLDRVALEHDMGHEFVEKYSKRSSYECMSVRPLKKAQVG